MGGGHHHGGGFRAPRMYGGGGYFAPSVYSSWYDSPSYVPIFVVEDDEEEKRKRLAAEIAAQLAAQKAQKRATHGIGAFGIFQPASKVARPLGSALGVVFGNTTYDAKVAETQKWLNGYLTQLGFTTLTLDGKLGAKTCGACAWAFGNTPDVDISTAPSSFFEVWQVCSTSSQTMPTAVTAAAKTSAYSTGVQAMQTIPNTELVQQTQAALNVALKAAGMCAITMDGKAGPETCGAQKWLVNHGGDGLTQEQRNSIYPTCSVVNTIAPSACPVAVATQAAAPAPVTAAIVPAPAPTPAPKMSKASMVMGLGIAAAVAGAAYYYFQHKASGG